jgi:hypothetical protein
MAVACSTISVPVVFGTVYGRVAPLIVVRLYVPATLALLGPVLSLPHAASSATAATATAALAKRADEMFVFECIDRSSR